MEDKMRRRMAIKDLRLRFDSLSAAAFNDQYIRCYKKGKGKGASLISSLKTYRPTLHFTPLVTRPAHSCAISTQQRAYSPAAVSAH